MSKLEVVPRNGRPASANGRPYPAFDLAQEVRKLRRESDWHGGRISRTLVKYPELRMVLTALEAGSATAEHRTAGRISLETVEGHLRMHAGGRWLDVPAGRLVILDGAIPYSVIALEDSAFLLTITWPVGLVAHAGAGLASEGA